MNVTTGRQIVLAVRPKGKPQLTDFRLEMQIVTVQIAKTYRAVEVSAPAVGDG